QERAFMQLLSWYSAQAYERARLYAAEKTAHETAVLDRKRAEFLASAGTILSSSLDLDATLASLAKAAVPHVADWCIVELAASRGADRPVVAAHRDPGKLESVLALRRHIRRAVGFSYGLDAAIASGMALLTREITEALRVEQFPENPELHRLCADVGVV